MCRKCVHLNTNCCLTIVCLLELKEYSPRIERSTLWQNRGEQLNGVNSRCSVSVPVSFYFSHERCHEAKVRNTSTTRSSDNPHSTLFRSASDRPIVEKHLPGARPSTTNEIAPTSTRHSTLVYPALDTRLPCNLQPGTRPLLPGTRHPTIQRAPGHPSSGIDSIPSSGIDSIPACTYNHRTAEHRLSSTGKSRMPPRRLIALIALIFLLYAVIALVAYNADTVDAFLWRLSR